MKQNARKIIAAVAITIMVALPLGAPNAHVAGGQGEWPFKVVKVKG